MAHTFLSLRYPADRYCLEQVYVMDIQRKGKMSIKYSRYIPATLLAGLLVLSSVSLSFSANFSPTLQRFNVPDLLQYDFDHFYIQVVNIGELKSGMVKLRWISNGESTLSSAFGDDGFSELFSVVKQSET